MCITSGSELLTIQKDRLKRREQLKKRIIVCGGPGCLANGAIKIVEQFKKVLSDNDNHGYTIESIVETGCHGFCEKGPLVVIEPKGLFYSHVKVKDVADIVELSVIGDETIEKLLYKDSKTSDTIPYYKDIPFYKNQTKITLRNLGNISASDINEYITEGGYQSFAKVLSEFSPDQVIETVEQSGLRGRGGGGFPAGRKWRTCKNVDEDIRYVICNGDEGDPGAFMDRAIMEGDPHTVLEGMMIAAYAVGAQQGYIYVREEYPLAVERLKKAIESCREMKLLGQNILNSEFSFDINISIGAGAFVCGESSALMKSIAGEVGEPRAKYVRSVIKGLYDKPTVLNNVETYANVPVIFEKGAEWFQSIGTKKNSGTKAFSLVGKVKHTGLIEVPMGITLREIIYDIGGGIIDDRPFKAVQTGGPSGGCLPESELDLPVDFDSLTKAGSMMGSGGMIVMDDKTCMVDVAKYFLEFLVKESCGKCVPCREGLYQLHQYAEKISKGNATENDLDKMESLSKVVVTSSLCGLGKSGPNPFLSTIQYFRDEYLAHINDKKCPAGVCKDLITYDINDKCTGCVACVTVCAYDAISGKKNELHLIDQKACTQCGACIAVCTFDAIDVF